MLFGPGTRVVVYPNANLTIGGGFCTSALTNIICQGTISIGHNFLSSWNTYIMDTDLHGIIDLETGKTGNYVKPISIGNDVWIGMNSSILKGSTIPNGCIVAASSVVSRQFKITNTIIAGNPAVVVKNNIIIDNNTK